MVQVTMKNLFDECASEYKRRYDGHMPMSESVRDDAMALARGEGAPKFLAMWCDFIDTYKFTRTMSNFIKETAFAEYQQRFARSHGKGQRGKPVREAEKPPFTFYQCDRKGCGHFTYLWTGGDVTWDDWPEVRPEPCEKCASNKYGDGIYTSRMVRDDVYERIVGAEAWKQGLPEAIAGHVEKIVEQTQEVQDDGQWL